LIHSEVLNETGNHGVPDPLGADRRRGKTSAVGDGATAGTMKSPAAKLAGLFSIQVKGLLSPVPFSTPVN